MAKTSKSAWTQRERDVAAMFGCNRQRCSGSSGREDCSRSDATHERLFIETKLRERHTARTLYDETKILARKEGKTPVIALACKGRPGFLVAVHSDDIATLVVEYIEANPSPELEGRVLGAIERGRVTNRERGSHGDRSEP